MEEDCGREEPRDREVPNRTGHDPRSIEGAAETRSSAASWIEWSRIQHRESILGKVTLGFLGPKVITRTAAQFVSLLLVDKLQISPPALIEGLQERPLITTADAGDVSHRVDREC